MKKLIKVSPLDEDMMTDVDLYIYSYRKKEDNLDLFNKIFEQYYLAYDLDFMFDDQHEPLFRMEQFNIEDSHDVYVVRPSNIIESDEIKSYSVPVSEVDPIDYVLDAYAHDLATSRYTVEFIYDGLHERFFREENDYILSEEEVQKQFNDYFEWNQDFYQQYYDYIINGNEEIVFTNDFILHATKKLIKEDKHYLYFTIEKVVEDGEMEIVLKRDNQQPRIKF